MAKKFTLRDKIKFTGLGYAIKSLEEKLRDLQKHQMEKEQVRGFNEGGASIDKSEQDLTSHIAEIESQLREFENEREELLQQIDQIIVDLSDDIVTENEPFAAVSDEYEAIADFYRHWGIDCEVEMLEGGNARIVVNNPGAYEGEDLLTMSQEELEEMLDEIGEEKPQENEKEKGQEGDKEKSAKPKIIEDKEDSKEADKKNLKDPKPMALMPGDIIQDREDENKKDKTKGALVGRKKEGSKKKNKAEESSSKKDENEQEEDVQIPDYFESEEALEKAGLGKKKIKSRHER